MIGQFKIRIAQLSVVAGVLGIAEFVVRQGYVSDLFLPTPSQVAEEFIVLLRSGELLHHTWVTLSEFLFGFGLAAPVAILMGVSIGRYRTLDRFSAPFLAAGMATPRVAMAPLFVLWLGIGLYSKIGLVVSTAFFPIIFNTIVGVKEVNPILVKAARSLGASPFQIIQKVILPSALPIILTGLRLGAARGIVGAVIGEMIAAEAGLGWMIAVSAGVFRADRIFVALLVLTLGSVLILEAIGKIEQKVVLRWKGEGP